MFIDQRQTCRARQACRKTRVCGQRARREFVPPVHSGLIILTMYVSAKSMFLTCFTIQTAQNSAIRTAINMGVFEKIPLSGSGINVIDLSSELGVDVRLLSESKQQLCAGRVHHWRILLTRNPMIGQSELCVPL